MFRKIHLSKNKILEENEFSENEKNERETVQGELSLPDKKSVLRKAIEIYDFLNKLNSRLIRQDKKLSDIKESRKKEYTELQTYFQIVSECQKKTAELLNHNLEKHSLFPAILTIEMLSNLICSSTIQAESLVEGENENPKLNKLIENLRDIGRIAVLKKEQLGLLEICPKEFENFNKEQHEIVKAFETEDKNQHKKICQTISAGLIYHDKILRQAKVTVYRFCGDNS